MTMSNELWKLISSNSSASGIWYTVQRASWQTNPVLMDGESDGNVLKLDHLHGQPFIYKCKITDFFMKSVCSSWPGNGFDWWFEVFFNIVCLNTTVTKRAALTCTTLGGPSVRSAHEHQRLVTVKLLTFECYIFATRMHCKRLECIRMSCLLWPRCFHEAIKNFL